MHAESGSDTPAVIYTLSMAIQMIHFASPPEDRERIEARLRSALGDMYQTPPFQVDPDGMVRMAVNVKMRGG